MKYLGVLSRFRRSKRAVGEAPAGEMDRAATRSEITDEGIIAAVVWYKSYMQRRRVEEKSIARRRRQEGERVQAGL